MVRKFTLLFIELFWILLQDSIFWSAKLEFAWVITPIFLFLQGLLHLFQFYLLIFQEYLLLCYFTKILNLPSFILIFFLQRFLTIFLQFLLLNCSIIFLINFILLFLIHCLSIFISEILHFFFIIFLFFFNNFMQLTMAINNLLQLWSLRNEFFFLLLKIS